ncbi:MAG: biopolymer transporter ExbD [Burkholderiaceae bacterium]|nr:biopolymer transporter ExbD [Burkholderiaceae bacterium]
MAITFNKSCGADDALMSDINTTPLVDVMLVLLIIFLITIPVVNSSIVVRLPKETNQIHQTQLETIVVTVDAGGATYWLNEKLDTPQKLQNKLQSIASSSSKPEVHIRGDASANYQAIGQVVYALQQAGVTRIGFITQPPANN